MTRTRPPGCGAHEDAGQARRAIGRWGTAARVAVARNHQRPLLATGTLGSAANAVVFAGLYLTGEYAPPLSATGDATLIFYGASMLLAAACGSGGCEVLAISNLLLRRDDQVDCLLFAPIDRAERSLTDSDQPPSGAVRVGGHGTV